jgi:rare lipoprotein A
MMRVLAFVVGCGAALEEGAPLARPGDAMEGEASFYGRGFHGHRTANGERFDMRAMTAAHRTLPFGTRVRVTDLATGKSIVVRINDRGPFGDRGRIIDLSHGAARALGILRRGRARVRLEVVSTPPSP